MSIVLGTALVLAASSPAPQRTSEGMKSGPWGLAMILLLCVAVYFLWRSMNKHLKKAQQHFATEPRPATPAAAGEPDGATPFEARTDAPTEARSEMPGEAGGAEPAARNLSNAPRPPES